MTLVALVKLELVDRESFFAFHEMLPLPMFELRTIATRRAYFRNGWGIFCWKLRRLLKLGKEMNRVLVNYILLSELCCVFLHNLEALDILGLRLNDLAGNVWCLREEKAGEGCRGVSRLSRGRTGKGTRVGPLQGVLVRWLTMVLTVLMTLTSPSVDLRL